MVEVCLVLIGLPFKIYTSKAGNLEKNNKAELFDYLENSAFEISCILKNS
jgi:hypothetical protein